ncbi:hypothetical protein [Chryseobacterium profundimaris]
MLVEGDAEEILIPILSRKRRAVYR